MAFYQQEEKIEEGDKSKFNEAFLKMHRFHRCQERINMCRLNPLAMNEALGVWNFMAMISDCESLLMEVWGKLTSDERKEMIGMKENIEKFSEKYPVYDTNTNHTNGKTRLNMDMSVWNVLKKQIFKYECRVRELITRAGYDSPNYDEYDDDEL